MSPPKRPFARIAITLPPEVLALADRMARDLDRSRSWLIAEAVRRLAGGERSAPPTSVVGRSQAAGSQPAVVSEARPAAYAADQQVAEARARRLNADLALPPSERLRRAEEMLRLARLIRRWPRRVQIIGFETWEDWADWKRGRRVPT